MSKSLYSVALRITGPSAGAAYLSLVAASTKSVIVREIGVVTVAATATNVGIIRAATVGTASTSTAGQPHRTTADAATASVKSAWSSAPTIAGSPVYLRKAPLPATTGASVTWDGLDFVLEPSTGLLIWNYGGSAAADADIHIVWEEAY
jgi:phage tail sheath gpL-like